MKSEKDKRTEAISVRLTKEEFFKIEKAVISI
jgi:hypothetical protein